MAAKKVKKVYLLQVGEYNPEFYEVGESDLKSEIKLHLESDDIFLRDIKIWDVVDFDLEVNVNLKKKS